MNCYGWLGPRAMNYEVEQRDNQQGGLGSLRLYLEIEQMLNLTWFSYAAEGHRSSLGPWIVQEHAGWTAET